MIYIPQQPYFQGSNLIQALDVSVISSITDMTVNAAIDFFFQHLFSSTVQFSVTPWFQTCPESPLYIPNDLQIDLQESNLHSKEWELDSWIPVIVNSGRREQWSPGSDGPPAAPCLWGTICHYPSELMLSMCWSHFLRWCGLCDNATISKEKHNMSHAFI